MSKKKRKKTPILKAVDNQLDHTYDALMSEIQEMQLKIYYADQKAKKKAKKAARRKQQVNFDEIRKQTRMEVLQTMENTSFLDRAMNVIKSIAPIVVVIGRLIASLILAILSLDSVKMNIKPEILKKLNSVYNAAMSV